MSIQSSIERVVFLDRDGVINEFPGYGNYVTSWREFKFIPGSIEAIKKFKDCGFWVFVISNQAGVGKNIFSQKDLDIITTNMLKVLEKKGARVDGVYYCIHKPEDNCNCRKPKAGLLEKALEEAGIKKYKGFFIGDAITDIETAHRFGIDSVLVLSGREKLHSVKDWLIKPDYIFDNLLLASYYICNHYGR